MKIITIKSRTHGTHDIMVDDEDFVWLINYKWHIFKGKTGPLYAKTRYVDPLNPRKRFPMHRMILGVTDKNQHIDHRDRNSFNNQKHNLRLCSIAENSRNSFNKKQNKTGYKGVKLNPSGRYQVAIKTNGIKSYHGTYKTPEEAAKKYNELARQYHGEFAYQNPV